MVKALQVFLLVPQSIRIALDNTTDGRCLTISLTKLVNQIKKFEALGRECNKILMKMIFMNDNIQWECSQKATPCPRGYYLQALPQSDRDRCFSGGGFRARNKFWLHQRKIQCLSFFFFFLPLKQSLRTDPCRNSLVYAFSLLFHLHFTGSSKSHTFIKSHFLSQKGNLGSLREAQQQERG